MAQSTKSFRFRIPWLSVPSESFARRSKERPKSPPHSDTSVPIHRPSKPSVVAPSELSPHSPIKTEQAPRAEPQKTSLSTDESLVTTRPKPPSPQPPLQPSSHADSPSQVHIAPSSPKTRKASENGAANMPKPVAEETAPPASSSSQQEKEKMVLSELKPQEAKPKVESPLRTITKSPETSFQPDERMSTEAADIEQQVYSTPSSSPVSKTEPITHPSSPLVSKDIKTEETTHQEEKEKMAGLVPQEEKPKIKSPLKNIPKSPESSSQPENLSTQQPTTIEQRSTTPKSKSLEREEKEKVAHETTKARGKGKDTTTTGQPSEQRISVASASGTTTTTTTKAKDLFGFRGEKKHHGARETVEGKIMFATTNPIGKDTRLLSSTDEGKRNVSSSSISPEKAASSSSGEKDPPLQKGIKDDITKFVHKLTASVHPTQHMDDKQFSVVTLAGDNRGATMHLSSESAKKEGSIHIHRAYKSDPEDTNEVTTDGEENTNEEDEEVGMAYVNSNIQSINNSLMFHGSITERDPGVQVTLPQKSDDKPDPGLETQRTRFNVNRAEKSTYRPTVGRSIRGPFLEPDDKPHRHGCNFSCDKDIEDIEIV